MSEADELGTPGPEGLTTFDQRRVGLDCLEQSFLSLMILTVGPGSNVDLNTLIVMMVPQQRLQVFPAVQGADGHPCLGSNTGSRVFG